MWKPGLAGGGGAMIYIFSGVDRPKFVNIIASEGAAGMVNILDLSESLFNALLRFPDTKFVVDSGAFQGNTDLDSYAAWICKNHWRFDWLANLDVINDQEKSDTNYEKLRNILPTEAFKKILWVYQRGGLDYLQDMASKLGHIAVGGGIAQMQTEDSIRFIDGLGKVLEKSGAKAHFFGGGSPHIISRFKDASWFDSVDSAGWLCGAKAFELIRQDGVRVKASNLKILLTREECLSVNIRSIHSWIYGKSIQLAML